MSFWSKLKDQFSWWGSCEICGEKTTETIRFISAGAKDSKNMPLCRPHLIEEYRKLFVASPHKFVVCYPRLDSSYGATYGFYPLGDLVQAYSFPQEDQDTVASLLDKISGQKCERCSKKASCLFFQNGEYDANGPVISTLSKEQGQYMCSTHAFARIETALKDSAGEFSEGLVPPSDTDGIFVSTQI